MNKKHEPTLYQQLVFDFDQVIPEHPSESISEQNPAALLFDTEGRRGTVERSAFSVFLSEYMPDFGFFSRCFSNMEEAEDQLYMGYGRYPERAQQIDRLFPAMYMSSVLKSGGYNLYVAHLIQLVNRVGEGCDTVSVATDAEVLAAIHGISLITPTKKFVGQGYWHLFQKLFPRKSRQLKGEIDPIFPMPTTAYERDQVFDFIEGLRKKLFIKSRTLSDTERRTYEYSWNLKRFYFNNRRHAPKGFFQSDEAAHFLKMKEVAA